MIKTERLLLRNYKESDFDRVHLYASLPDFSQFDVWGPNTEEDTRNASSYKVMEKMGMKRVGHMLKDKKRRGVLRDSYRYEIYPEGI